MLPLNGSDAGIAGLRATSRPSRERRSQAAFLAVVVLLCLTGAAGTILGSVWMARMGTEPMPGGWMLSNAWIRRCGRTTPGFALAFLVHWLAMTAAMMLPSFVPMLRRCHAIMASVRVARPALRSLAIVLGWFAAWALAGSVVLVVGSLLTRLALGEPVFARIVPLAAAGAVTLAGAVQLGAWKSRHLATCRDAPAGDRIVLGGAWRFGLHLGRGCLCTCGGWMTALLVTDAMDLRTTALAALVIAAERVAPDPRPITEVAGAALIGIGLASFVRAAFG